MQMVAAVSVTESGHFRAKKSGPKPAPLVSVWSLWVYAALRPFLLLALLSNVLSTKATAVLFTPIAVDLARVLGAPVEPFAVAVIFASNCSFASPIGYQTNLVVMTPGNYRFIDFVKVGTPLILLVWIAFTLFAPWYYGLPL